MNLEIRTLIGDFIRLEPLAARHLDGLRQAADDAAIWAWMPVALDGENFAPALAAAAREQSDRITFAVIRQGTEEIVGSSSYMAIEAHHRRAEIGFTWYAPRHQGSAVNPECKKLMLGHAFECGAERVEFKTDACNAPSRAALAKLGAREEGVFRRHMIRPDGSFRDSVYFSILREEWPQMRAGLERRLAAFAEGAR